MKGLKQIYLIATLMGKDQSQLNFNLSDQSSSLLPKINQEVPIGLKSDLLKRRFDIAISQLELEKSAQEIGVAKSEFFPSFSLTSAIGISSLKFNNTFDYSNKFWSYGASLDMPIFRLPAIKANLDIAKALNDTSLLNYQNIPMLGSCLLDKKMKFVHLFFSSLL